MCAPLCVDKVKVKSTETMCVLKVNKAGVSAHVFAPQLLTQLSWLTINVIKQVHSPLMPCDMKDDIGALKISEEFYFKMGHRTVECWYKGHSILAD